MINLELYRIFYVVAECKNITKASEMLNISQPAVTKHIKNLEDALGTPLFIRTKKGVILNEYGEKIFLNVKQALTLLDDSEREINYLNKNNKGTIRIGISTSLAKKFLIKRIENFHKLYPNIIITINTDTTKDHIKQLKSGIIDLIICKFPEHEDLDLNYLKLGESKYIFACSKDYSNLLDRKVNIEELKEYPLLFQKSSSNSRESIEKYLKENSVKIEPKMNIASSNLLVDFTKIGYGIGYLTKLYVEEELKDKDIYEIDIRPDTEKINYGIVTLKNNIMPSYCTKLIEYLKNNMI